VIWTSVAFLCVFGVSLVWSGAGRLFGVAADAKKGEAIVWGSIGLVLGAAMLASGLYVLVTFYPRHGTATR
jgi:hypothetical protein